MATPSLLVRVWEFPLVAHKSFQVMARKSSQAVDDTHTRSNLTCKDLD